MFTPSPAVYDFLQAACKAGGRVFGGFVRQVSVPGGTGKFKDIDLWFTSKEQAQKFIDSCLNLSVNSTKNNYYHMMNPNLNLIKATLTLTDNETSKNGVVMKVTKKIPIDFVCSSKLDITDFDVNRLTVDYSDYHEGVAINGVQRSRFSDPDLYEKIKNKQATMLSTLFELFVKVYRCRSAKETTDVKRQREMASFQFYRMARLYMHTWEIKTPLGKVIPLVDLMGERLQDVNNLVNPLTYEWFNDSDPRIKERNVPHFSEIPGYQLSWMYKAPTPKAASTKIEETTKVVPKQEAKKDFAGGIGVFSSKPKSELDVVGYNVDNGKFETLRETLDRDAHRGAETDESVKKEIARAFKERDDKQYGPKKGTHITVVEEKEDQSLDKAVVKRLTGGDSITARKLSDPDPCLCTFENGIFKVCNEHSHLEVPLNKFINITVKNRIPLRIVTTCGCRTFVDDTFEPCDEHKKYVRDTYNVESKFVESSKAIAQVQQHAKKNLNVVLENNYQTGKKILLTLDMYEQTLEELNKQLGALQVSSPLQNTRIKLLQKRITRHNKLLQEAIRLNLNL